MCDAAWILLTALVGVSVFAATLAYLFIQEATISDQLRKRAQHAEAQIARRAPGGLNSDRARGP